MQREERLISWGKGLAETGGLSNRRIERFIAMDDSDIWLKLGLGVRMVLRQKLAKPGLLFQEFALKCLHQIVDGHHEFAAQFSGVLPAG